MYLAYTYLITNKITSQFYYGFRCNNIKLKRRVEDDFWIKYFTSSKIVKKLIKEYGKDSFEFKILVKDIDPYKCYLREQELISHYLGTPLCLNQHCDLNGKWYTGGSTTNRGRSSPAKGKSVSTETKIKLSAALKGRPSPMTGKHHSDETREKISRSHLGKEGHAQSPETRAKISAAMVENRRIRNLEALHENT